MKKFNYVIIIRPCIIGSMIGKDRLTQDGPNTLKAIEVEK